MVNTKKQLDILYLKNWRQICVWQILNCEPNERRDLGRFKKTIKGMSSHKWSESEREGQGVFKVIAVYMASWGRIIGGTPKYWFYFRLWVRYKLT